MLVVVMKSKSKDIDWLLWWVFVVKMKDVCLSFCYIFVGYCVECVALFAWFVESVFWIPVEVPLWSPHGHNLVFCVCHNLIWVSTCVHVLCVCMCFVCVCGICVLGPCRVWLFSLTKSIIFVLRFCVLFQKWMMMNFLYLRFTLGEDSRI